MSKKEKSYKTDTLIVRNYHSGIAEVWHDYKKIGWIGTGQAIGGVFGHDYERDLMLLQTLGEKFGFKVKRLNCEENEVYEKEVKELAD